VSTDLGGGATRIKIPSMSPQKNQPVAYSMVNSWHSGCEKMAYRFLFSYARENRDRDLDRFFKNLCTAVKLEEYVPKDELAFFDGKSIQTGEPWRDELATG
jgi:hypothetical protein